MKISSSVIHAPGFRAGALLVILTSSVGAPSLAQETILLRMDAQVGRVTRYDTQTQSWLPGFPTDSDLPSIVMTDLTSESITAAEGDSRTVTTVVVSSQLDMSRTSELAPMKNATKDMTMVRRIDSRGRVLSSQVTRQGQGMDGSAAQHAASSFSLPEAAVRVGDTWTAMETMPMGPGTGGRTATVKVTYRLERIGFKGVEHIAVISMNGTVTGWLELRGLSPNLRLEKSSRPASGTMSGEILLDLDAKWVISLTTGMEEEWGTTRGTKTRMTRTAR